MVRVFVFFAALGVSSASLAQPSTRDTSAAPSGTSVIRGRVVAAGTDHPLGHVEVRVLSAPIRVNTAVRTAADGTYEIMGLPAGTFNVTAVKPNYVPSGWGQRRLLGPAEPIELANGQVRSGINFTLQRAGVITG
jgi:hypothetical protein